MATDKNEKAEFNGRNEEENMREEFREERQGAEGEFSKTENELSLGNSVRNFGEVSGTTFGAESNPAKFSNIDQQANESDKGNAGSGQGSNSRMGSDSLNQAQNDFISGRGEFDRNQGNDSGAA